MVDNVYIIRETTTCVYSSLLLLLFILRLGIVILISSTIIGFTTYTYIDILYCCGVGLHFHYFRSLHVLRRPRSSKLKQYLALSVLFVSLYMSITCSQSLASQRQARTICSNEHTNNFPWGNFQRYRVAFQGYSTVVYISNFVDRCVRYGGNKEGVNNYMHDTCSSTFVHTYDPISCITN